MIKYILAFIIFLVSGIDSAYATNCPAYPYTLTNGQIADANQVMANFNSILNCANSNLVLAPVTIAQGGTSATDPVTALSNLGGTSSILTLALLRAAATPVGAVIYLQGTTNPGDGVQGFFSWNAASSCTDDAGQTCVKPTAVSGSGRWVRIPDGWANGGVTNTGGAILTGTIGTSPLNGVTVPRTDAQFQISNSDPTGGTHALLANFNTYKPCVGTPLATITASITTNQLTVTAGPALSTTKLICGSIGSFGAVANGTTIVSGASSPYTLNISQSVGSQTMYEYPAPQEASYSMFGYTSTGAVIETGSLNATWGTNNNDNSAGYTALCFAALTAAGAENCSILEFGNNSLILGGSFSGGDYISPGANVTQIYQQLSVRGGTTLGTNAAPPQVVIQPTGSNNAVMDIIRSANTLSASIQFETGAGPTANWETGVDPIFTTNTDFGIYNLGLTSLALDIGYADNKVTIFNVLSLPGIGSAGAGSKALCMNGSNVVLSTTNACPP